MFAFKELAAAITVWVLLVFATGHRQWVFDGIAFARKHAISEVRKPWGCPSIFNRKACTSWGVAFSTAPNSGRAVNSRKFMKFDHLHMSHAWDILAQAAPSKRIEATR